MGVLRRAGLDEATARSATEPCTPTPSASRRWKPPGWLGPGNGDTGSLAHQLAAYTTAGQFIEGLRYLLEGIGRHVGTGPGPSQ